MGHSTHRMRDLPTENSGDFLAQICEDPTARKFLYRAFHFRKDVYLVVGLNSARHKGGFSVQSYESSIPDHDNRETDMIGDHHRASRL